MSLLLTVLTLSTPVESSLAPEPATTFLAPAPAVSADMPEMEYTYVEANYMWTDSDQAGESLGGIEAIGSLELPLNFFTQLRYAHLENGPSIDSWRLGLGYHLPVGARIDAYGIVSFASTKLDGSASNFDDNGVAGELGLRFLLSSKFEVNGRVEWANVDNDVYTYGLGARYYLMDRLSLGGRVESIDGDTSFALGARFEL